MANTKHWNVDPAHSQVQFKIKHLVISTVTGSFKTFNGEVHSDGDNFDGADVNFFIEVKSIDTNNADRDDHLRSEDFFASDKYETIHFRNGSLHKTSDDNYTLKGDIEIRGVAKPIELAVEYGGLATDPWGMVKAGFEVTGKLNRKDFGLVWNTTTEAGGLLVGEEVKLFINIQLEEANH